MDSETVLTTISVIWLKWRAVKNPFHKQAMRRKLLKLMTIRDMLAREEEKRRKREFWVRPIFTAERRYQQGASDNLVEEMRSHDHEKFVNYFRMTPQLFDSLFTRLQPRLSKQTVIRDPIPARTRMEIVLRYLASGDSMTSISYAFRIAPNTVSKIVTEGCDVIWSSLKDEVFLPINKDNWSAVAAGFEEKWNFPNCVGAIDGKHVVLQAPPNSGSTYYNYKGNHSLILLASCDAHYRFIMLDIGAPGRRSDGGIFRDSEIGRGFEQKLHDLPGPRSVGNGGPILPFVMVADEAFPLTTYMMRPYPRRGTLNRSKKVFNYRLSRARRMIESAFGILSAKWRIFRRPIVASVPTATKVIQATCCLHNYILSYEAEMPSTQRFYSTLSIEERSAGSFALRDIEDVGLHARNSSAIRIREEYTTFFEGIGAVPWQWEKAMTNDF